MSRQTRNGQLTAAEQSKSLILSIDRVHAERIFNGEKKYELRKRLPKRPFDTVYLYANGSQGIVGAFRVGKVLHMSVDDLWRTVGERATPKDRFFKYFGLRDKGYALEVVDPVRFAPELSVPEIKVVAPNFVAPQSFYFPKAGSRLSRALENRLENATYADRIALKPIKAEEEDQFIDIVTSEIGSRYADITEGFAKSLLDTNRAGKDPRGILTTSKKVLSICLQDGTLIGFTTITLKLGGCAKTGPTILFHDYRRKGFGVVLRSKLLCWARTNGIRKLYCTCPDHDPAVLRYLLRSGYSVEAHLKDHYHTDHGEFVVGLFVEPPSPLCKDYGDLTRNRMAVLECDQKTKKNVRKSVLKRFREVFPAMTGNHLDGILSRTGCQEAVDFEQKTLRLFSVGTEDTCHGILLLIPKRGGAVKALLLSGTANRQTLSKIEKTAKEYARDINARKVYFFVPVFEGPVVHFLREKGYQIEGILREPYQTGVDLVALCQFSTST